MANNLTGEKIAVWKETRDALQPELPNVPEVTDHHSQLSEFIEEGERLQVQQKGLRAELQSVNRRRRELAAAGEDLRLRIAAFLQAKHGFKNEKLISFGVKPRRSTRRTRKTEEQPPEAPAAVLGPSDTQ